MTDQSNYRLFLDEHFKNINVCLERIEKQTTKTSNRVTDLEKDLLEYKFVKKYPKLIILVITVLVIGTVIGAVKSFQIPSRIDIKMNTVEETLKDEIKKIEGISKVTRSGYVKYNNNGLRDSIKIK